MTGLAHALTGIGIGLALHQPLLIIPVALLSHFALDVLPHFHHRALGDSSQRPWNKHLRRMIIGDAILSALAILAALLAWPQARFATSVGAFFAMVPDFLWPLRGKIRRLEKFFRFHQFIQWAEKPWGSLVEAPYLILIVSVLAHALQ